MSKPIDQPEFWSERLQQAEARGRLEDSVYVTTKEDWEVVNSIHAQFLREHVTPEQRVLDAGCGYGRASTFIPGEYWGVDSCQDMIHKARTLYPDKQFFVGDLNQLEFGTAFFDWVVAISVREMVVRELGKEAWLVMRKELLRVARRGIIALEYGNQTGEPTQRIIFE